ncbi:hypothetical protein MKW94_003379 [Papaver nudicaule]|uniref:Cryptochrome DASH n=1 Tax=Papaver nudicaule TaxID=74823 RepID=A0AA41RY91_PAPNU|nr:hypothetical protein [Papaver nudicaule]
MSSAKSLALSSISSAFSFSTIRKIQTFSFSIPISSHTKTMNIAASSQQSQQPRAAVVVVVVPSLDSVETDKVTDETFRRYYSNTKRKGGNGGVSIVWFRNDLRVLDNEALFRAWMSSASILPVYCVDPRNFGTTHYFGFPKTGALRAQFLIECLADLKKNLMKRGLNLVIRHGKPEDILPSIAKAFGAHTIYAQKETCSEELLVERLVQKGLKGVSLPSEGSTSTSRNATNMKLELIWGTTMYHIDDLPFTPSSLPDIYTQFRKSVESKCAIRGCFKLPPSIGPLPNDDLGKIGGWGDVPSLDQLGVIYEEASHCALFHAKKGMCFVGGESAALGRVYEYFWKKDLLKVYKHTRNGMLGPDYSTKFSPWLAFGNVSPRFLYEEVKRYEKDRLANDSTYWVLFELIWRDYFRFISIKYGNSIFHLGGPREVQGRWSQDLNLLERRTYRIVCSFLVRDMGIDWRMGAEWFETCLLDYDPCSNYGNWTYGAGVGNDPREDRYFSIPKQAQNYDPDGEYVAYWLPELRKLPKDKRNFPQGMSYIRKIVPLKFSKPNHGDSHTKSTSRRK